MKPLNWIKFYSGHCYVMQLVARHCWGLKLKNKKKNYSTYSATLYKVCRISGWSRVIIDQKKIKA